MLRAIATREFTACILAFRFGLVMAASAVLLCLSAYVLRADYAQRLGAHAAEKGRVEAELSRIRVYAQLEVATSRPPSPLSVFSEGLEKRLGTVLRFSYARAPTLRTWEKETNPLLDAFPPFDLASVAQMLFSLTALFLAFDAISGEVENRTLQLVLSHGVPRWKVYMGKWLGGGTAGLLPAVFGMVLATAVLSASDVLDFTGADWVRIVLIGVTVCLYILTFHALGLAVSSACRSSSSSLVVCIALWTTCTIVAPATVTYAVSELTPLPSVRAVEEGIQQRETDFQTEYAARFEQLQEDFSDQVGRSMLFGMSTTYTQAPVSYIITVSGLFRESVPILADFYQRFEPRRIEAGDAMARLEDGLVSGWRRQVHLVEQLSRPFLAPAFHDAITRLAATDMASFEGFQRHARQHRQRLVDWMRSRDLFSSALFYNPIPEDELLSVEETWQLWESGGRQQGRKVDLDIVPAFPDYHPDLRTVAGDIGVDWAFLIGGQVLLLFGGLAYFSRRQLT